MEEIKSNILDKRPGMKLITVESHVRRMKKLYEKMKTSENNTLMKILKNYKDVFKFLEKNYKLQTRKAVISSIVVSLKSLNANDSIVAEYNSKMLEIGKEIDEINSKNERSEKEQKNWITQTEFKCKIKELEELLAKKQTIEGNVILFDLYQQYTILNLYHLIPPLRNDFVGTEVYDTYSSFWTSMDKNINYIFLKDKELVLNRYKTNKIYGENNKRTLPDKLVSIISKWMEMRVKIFPNLSSERQLLLNLRRKTPMNQVNLTHYLNKIFKRKVSSTLLRKSYLSEKYPVTSTVNDMQKDAELMCHDFKTQQSVYRKKST